MPGTDRPTLPAPIALLVALQACEWRQVGHRGLQNASPIGVLRLAPTADLVAQFAGQVAWIARDAPAIAP